MKLENCEKQNKNHPKTFQIPPMIIRQNLRKGDFAKLIFKFTKAESSDFGGERMWVKIVGHTDDGYVGKLNNRPILTDVISFGDEVRFEAKHIADFELKRQRKFRRSNVR